MARKSKKFKKIKDFSLPSEGNEESFAEEKNKNSRNKRFLIGFLVFLIAFILFNNFLLLRNFSSRQIDDMTPLINCVAEKDYVAKSEILMVIPLYKGESIAGNKTWCNYILGLNKTLGMHGVYHTYQEFNETRDENYFKLGMEEFKKCFGEYPKYFEAPQLVMAVENVKTAESLNMSVEGYGFNILHKVYHCGDSGKVSNRMINWI